jgi:two-component system OmpR family sensor kinase
LISQLLAVALTGVITFLYVREELEELFDDRLRELAYSLQINDNFVPNTQLPPDNIHDDDDNFVIQVWNAEGLILFRLNRTEGTPALAKEGFSNNDNDGILWRSFVLRRGDKFVQVSQAVFERLETSTEVALGAIAPVVILILVLGILVRVSVNYALGPLTTLTSALDKRRPYALEPLPDEGLPDEVRPLVSVLNSLLERLDIALQSQRKFVADAAHELRTPLAAVQLQTQLLQKIDNAEERQQALVQIRAGTARASHLVHQLLTLARLEPEDWSRPSVTVDLSALVKAVVSEQVQFALSRQIDLGVTEDEDVAIMGDVESLRVMLNNLIDNALRYSQHGEQVDVALKKKGSVVQIEVLDRGPGIPAAERENVFNRFYRLPGTSELGSGLGLAIVQEVVYRHRGEISLHARENSPGLKVQITLPFSPKNMLG